MKNILAILVTLIIVSCNSNGGKDTKTAASDSLNANNYTTVLWSDSVQNLGELQEGAVAQIKFHFKNTGDKPLLILSAQPGCGCTVADYPKEPIAPGQTGEVVAAFDTKKGQPGEFKKNITVTTNTKPNGNTILSFQGTIKGKSGQAEDAPKPVESAG